MEQDNAAGSVLDDPAVSRSGRWANERVPVTSETFIQFRQGTRLALFDNLDRVRLVSAVTTDDGDVVQRGVEGTVLAAGADGVAYVVEFAEPMGALATVHGSNLQRLGYSDT